MKLEELREAYFEGKIEKRVYWQIVRENFTHVLPQLQDLITKNVEVDSIEITDGGCILKKRGGVSLYFDFQQALCRAEAELLMDGDPEKEDMRFINDYLSSYEDSSMLDIGANVGIFSLDIYKKHELKHYLFEPVPNTFQWLLKNAELNNVDQERYLPFNIGMSDKKADLVFYVPASNEAASLVANEDSFYRKKASSDGEYTGSIEIDEVLCMVDTVDSFIEEHNIQNVSFIKIDVEGNELNVLRGAKKTLLECKPLVYCELLRKHAKRFGYHPNDAIDYMNDLGYSCNIINNGSLKRINTIDEKTIETNFIFVADRI